MSADRAVAARRERQREQARLERRWFLITVGAFALSMLVLAGLYGIYKATGPHPEVLRLIRRLKFYARWILPGI